MTIGVPSHVASCAIDCMFGSVLGHVSLVAMLDSLVPGESAASFPVHALVLKCTWVENLQVTIVNDHGSQIMKERY